MLGKCWLNHSAQILLSAGNFRVLDRYDSEKLTPIRLVLTGLVTKARLTDPDLSGSGGDRGLLSLPSATALAATRQSTVSTCFTASQQGPKLHTHRRN
ncbi:hypothetical protein GCM10007382_26830 [Salinibacterium xinjiangense]|nr:hypothetical protein GCM10007382_26830 [Salinibacterium xinjiangense]